ncbi:MAG: type II toxin-antitoxin system VapC family toxin [Alphaproteobacteria bacterium]|nr:type II toxin-antitoxin system VapC family toxin [Alphaproteobacteria bacterium]
MSGYVVDASVAVKWLVDEPFSDEAARLLDDGIALVAPELVYVESANALWAMHRRGDIGLSDFTEALSVLKAAPVAVPASMRQLAAPAGRLAVDLGHPVYDCVYLALALQEQCPVVTADPRLYDVVRAHPYLSDRILHLKDLPER